MAARTGAHRSCQADSSARSTALALQEPAGNRVLHSPARRPLEHNPAAVYLGRLATSSRRVMRGGLDSLAILVARDDSDALSLLRSRADRSLRELAHRRAGHQTRID